MRKKIIISAPIIKKGQTDVFADSIRLSADVTMENPNTGITETKECFFEFDSKYKDFLTPERSDAFVMGLLITAMENSCDIEFNTPLSESLYYTLTTQYIPLIAKYNQKYPLYYIDLIGPYDNIPIENEGAVGAGCSGGVDSFYTIAKFNEGYEMKNERLTHIVLSSTGTGDNVENRIKKVFKENMEYISKIAKSGKLGFVACYTNLYEFYKTPLDSFVTFFTTTYGSIIYAAQKLFSIYYINSGGSIAKFNLDVRGSKGYDASTFDVFSTACMNTENLKFYTTGMDAERIDKESALADNPLAQKYLKVCNLDEFKEEKMEKPNCSFCTKCLRTMSHLYALNKLELFDQVFDVENFLKHKSKYIGKMLGTDKKDYIHELEECAKANNVKIPFGAYLYAFLWYKPIKFLRKKLKNVLFLRKIYYKLNIDYKLDGYRGANYQKYKDKM